MPPMASAADGGGSSLGCESAIQALTYANSQNTKCAVGLLAMSPPGGRIGAVHRAVVASLQRTHRTHPSPLALLSRGARRLGIFFLLFVSNGCAAGIDGPQERLLLSTIVADAGPPMAAPPFTGEMCGVLGERAPCPCPDGTTEGIKVCSADASSPTGTAFSSCVACPGTPIVSSLAGAPAGLTAGAGAASTAGVAAAVAGAAPATAGTTAPLSPGAGGGTPDAGAAGSASMAASGGTGGSVSVVVAGGAADAGVPSAGTGAAGTGAAGQSGAAGTSSSRAGAGGSSTAGSSGGTAAGVCSCQRLCLIGSEPCCRSDGRCGCTLLFGLGCL